MVNILLAVGLVVLVDVTLTDGRITLKIEGILIFEEDEFTVDDFDCAVTLAREGEEGYTIIEELM